jgi:hypothetical protein
MEIIDDLLDIFCERYCPAANIVESDDLLSSQDILSLFNSIANIKLDDLYNGLKKRGFNTTMIENQFLWIVKKKSPS